MKYQATMPAFRCQADDKRTLEAIARSEDVPLSVMQRRAIRFFLASFDTKRIGKATRRIERGAANTTE